VGASDSFLLDACSETVTSIVERVGPSVAAVRIAGDESGGDGSSTLESAHVSQKTAKGHGHRHGKKSKTARQTTK